MNVTSTTQTQYTQTTNKAHRAEQNAETEYKQNEASVTQNSDTQNNQNKSLSVIKNFLNDLYSNESTSFKSSVIKDEIENKVNKYAQLIMDERGTASDSELQTSKLLNEYKKELLQEYKTSIESSTDTVMSAEQEAIIKVLMKENTQETSSLEALLATKTGTNATEETKATGRMAEMQEKYKDVYTPMPEKYSKDDEELQTRKVYEAYPNYISGPEFLRIVSSFLEGTRIQLGQELTPSQEESQKLDYAQAYEKAYDIFGGEESFIEMQKGVREIMKKYPVNNYGRDSRTHNATELSRFENASVYENLEKGKTIEEARMHAKGLMATFMDSGYTSYRQLDVFGNVFKMGLPPGFEEVDKNAEEYKIKFNHTMDLRQYGIEGDWRQHDVFENQNEMIAELEKKIGQFNFMLDNENLMEEAITKLEPNSRELGNTGGYKKLIDGEYMPRMQEALNIFKNYTIYD